MIRCPYPGCTLEEHEAGEHHIGRPERPRGILRLLQRFQRFEKPYVCGTPRCDLELFPGMYEHAMVFAADEFGFGWSLCEQCAEPLRLVAHNESQTKTQDSTHQTSSPTAPQRPQNPPPEKGRVKRATVIPFAARERGLR